MNKEKIKKIILKEYRFLVKKYNLNYIFLVLILRIIISIYRDRKNLK